MVLREEDVAPDPFEQFARWYREAASDPRADAMALATATADGVPSVRFVLLKGVDRHGFVFFTNYESRKGRELEENPRAALAFFWNRPGRQVRATGPVVRLPQEESKAYWRTRPRESQMAALASRQSRVIESRAALEEEYERLAAELDGGDVPLPPSWGGLRLEPEAIEFWQHRESRLHDRLRYTRRPDGTWRIERLAP
ncbi:MAG: pyridoxamine 5'-phosphate oxidase [Actinomycetota bacterium]|nr:pyridoxamine 5'-phosphate oxidase [Actinomycetota bacterium]